MTKAHTPHDPRRNTSRLRRDESGSILIPVAIALLGLLAFSAFTIDNGVMLSSRREAQNAADSAALAAALYLAWDNPNDQAGAQATAVAAAQQHLVWGNQPDVVLADVTFPPCPPGAPGLADDCVRVDVFRNQRGGGDPLPAFFAMLAGVTEQGVRATATAQILYGTAATDCLLPFAIPDRWIEVREDWNIAADPGVAPGDAIDDSNAPPALAYPYDSRNDFGLDGTFELWDPDDTFDIVEQQGQAGGDPLWPAQLVDLYAEGPWQPTTAPNYGDPNFHLDPTGYSQGYDHGLQVVVKAGTGGQVSPGFYYPVVIPDGLGSGGSTYRNRIEGCTGSYELTPGTNLSVEPGNMVGPTRQGVDYLRGLDPNSEWSDVLAGTVCVDNSDPCMTVPKRGKIINSCADDPAGCPSPWGYRSPVHRAVMVFDPRNFMEGNRTGRGDVYVTGIIGVFLGV